MKESYKSLVLKSGWSASIQASQTHYCTPRGEHGPYTHVEIGYPTMEEPLILSYAEDPNDPIGTVYGYVPVGILKAIIIKHGGIVSGEHPALALDDPQQTEILIDVLHNISEKR